MSDKEVVAFRSSIFTPHSDPTSCRPASRIGISQSAFANMQAPPDDWNELRLVLAISRAGALAGAAKALGIDHSTVYRRLQAIEAKLAVPLFERVAAREAGAGQSSAAPGAEARAGWCGDPAGRADHRGRIMQRTRHHRGRAGAQPPAEARPAGLRTGLPRRVDLLDAAALQRLRDSAHLVEAVDVLDALVVPPSHDSREPQCVSAAVT